MLKFEVRQLYLESVNRYYLPLPKMTRSQMGALAGRLRSLGISTVSRGGRITGDDAGTKVSITSSGLASSSEDMLDALLPAVPSLLHFPRERVPVNPYLLTKPTRTGLEIQFFPRMEGLRLWKELRTSGECGLTPDEKAVASRVLAPARQNLECITDYPTDGCSVVQFGTRQYYLSSIPAREFADRLRTTSTTSSKNSYLPRSSVIRLEEGRLPELSPDDLGEWCYLDFPKSL